MIKEYRKVTLGEFLEGLREAANEQNVFRRIECVWTNSREVCIGLLPTETNPNYDILKVKIGEEV